MISFESYLVSRQTYQCLVYWVTLILFSLVKYFKLSRKPFLTQSQSLLPDSDSSDSMLRCYHAMLQVTGTVAWCLQIFLHKMLHCQMLHKSPSRISAMRTSVFVWDADTLISQSEILETTITSAIIPRGLSLSVTRLRLFTLELLGQNKQH